MNIFAGNFSIARGLSEIPNIDFDIIKTWETSYFIMWADDDISNQQWVLELIEKHFWEIIHSNISIEWRDELEILNSEYEQWVYERVSFEWPNTNFRDIIERFSDSEEIICLRESGKSEIYGNAIVIADFIY